MNIPASVCPRVSYVDQSGVSKAEYQAMNKRNAAWLLSMTAAMAFGGAAGAQVIDTQDFEGAAYNGWLVNGNEMVFVGGNPGMFMGVPFADFWGVTLRNETPGSPALGNLTIHPSFRFSVDFRVTRLENWFQEPMDPAWFNLTLEFVDYTDNGPVSVYHVGPPLPQIIDGWTTYTWDVPDTSSTVLPPGWGGTGDEDPVTFEPRLPAGRTWTSVLANVDEVRVSTMQPGYFYSSSFWEAGFDNVNIIVIGGGACGTADFDGDGDVGTDGDIEAFFACLAGECCATCHSGGADFNGDGDVGTDADIEAFFRVLAGGNC